MWEFFTSWIPVFPSHEERMKRVVALLVDPLTYEELVKEHASNLKRDFPLAECNEEQPSGAFPHQVNVSDWNFFKLLFTSEGKHYARNVTYFRFVDSTTDAAYPSVSLCYALSPRPSLKPRQSLDASGPDRFF